MLNSPIPETSHARKSDESFLHALIANDDNAIQQLIETEHNSARTVTIDVPIRENTPRNLIAAVASGALTISVALSKDETDIDTIKSQLKEAIVNLISFAEAQGIDSRRLCLEAKSEIEDTRQTGR